MVTVGPAIAKALLKVWFKDADIAINVSSSIIDLIATRSKDRVAKQQARRQIERIGINAAKRLEPLFNVSGLSEDNQVAIAYAIADSLSNTPIDSRLIAQNNLDPLALANHLTSAQENQMIIRDLSSDELNLYKRALMEIAVDIVDIASNLPNFTEQTSAELLERTDSLILISNSLFAETRRLRDDIRQAEIEQAERDEAVDSFHARAVGLRVSQYGNEMTLSITNRGTHLITDIEINAIPDDENWHETTHGSLPLVKDKSTGVISPIMGGWFLAHVARLSPNRGIGIVTWQPSESYFTQIDFDVFWIDHTGMQRKSHAEFDVTVEGQVELIPRTSWNPHSP